MFYTMHGKVYGYLEHSQQIVYYSDTTRARETGRFGGYVLGSVWKEDGEDELGIVQYWIAGLAYKGACLCTMDV